MSSTREQALDRGEWAAVTEMPRLVRMNGIGPAIYGRRGTGDVYETTMYFAILWIPVVPIAQYRVSRKGIGYAFHEEHRPERNDWLRVAMYWTIVAVVVWLLARLG